MHSDSPVNTRFMKNCVTAQQITLEYIQFVSVEEIILGIITARNVARGAKVEYLYNS